MKNLLTTGEKIWMSSILLFYVWVAIGLSLEIPNRIISLFGSIGMVLFVAMAVLGIIFLRKGD